MQLMLSLFFFQAEDGIRDVAVTGVQTCALPIFLLPEAKARNSEWSCLNYRAARHEVPKLPKVFSSRCQTLQRSIPDSLRGLHLLCSLRMFFWPVQWLGPNRHFADAIRLAAFPLAYTSEP